MAVDWKQVTVAAVLATLILEHVGRRSNVWYVRPSTYLRMAVTSIRRVVRMTAAVYARIATFTALIDLWEMYITIKDLVIPVAELLNLPFDWRATAIKTAHEVASVDHMRVGTIVFICLGSAWYCGMERDFYILVVGALLCVLILIHLITARGRPSPGEAPGPAPERPNLPVGSPPLRRRSPKPSAVKSLVPVEKAADKKQ